MQQGFELFDRNVDEYRNSATNSYGTSDSAQRPQLYSLPSTSRFHAPPVFSYPSTSSTLSYTFSHPPRHSEEETPVEQRSWRSQVVEGIDGSKTYYEQGESEATGPYSSHEGGAYDQIRAGWGVEGLARGDIQTYDGSTSAYLPQPSIPPHPSSSYPFVPSHSILRGHQAQQRYPWSQETRLVSSVPSSQPQPQPFTFPAQYPRAQPIFRDEPPSSFPSRYPVPLQSLPPPPSLQSTFSSNATVYPLSPMNATQSQQGQSYGQGTSWTFDPCRRYSHSSVPTFASPPPPPGPSAFVQPKSDRRSSIISIDSISTDTSTLSYATYDDEPTRQTSLDSTISPPAKPESPSTSFSFESPIVPTCSVDYPPTSRSTLFASEFDDSRRFSWPLASHVASDYARNCLSQSPVLESSCKPSSPIYFAPTETAPPYDPQGLIFEPSRDEEPMFDEEDGEQEVSLDNGHDRGGGEGAGGGELEWEEVNIGAKALIGIKPAATALATQFPPIDTATLPDLPPSFDRSAWSRIESEDVGVESQDDIVVDIGGRDAKKDKHVTFINDQVENALEEPSSSSDDVQGDSEYAPPVSSISKRKIDKLKPSTRHDPPSQSPLSSAPSATSSSPVVSSSRSLSVSKPQVFPKMANEGSWESTSEFFAPFLALTEIIDINNKRIKLNTSIDNPSSFSFSTETGTWLTYRRNFLSLTVSVTFPTNAPLSSMHTSASRSPIARLEVSLVSLTCGEKGTNVELLQFDASRSLPKAKTLKAQTLKPSTESTSASRRKSLSRSQPADAADDNTPLTLATTFSRVQYRSSTSNHPAASQQNDDLHFFMRAILTAVHEDGSQSCIGTWSSAKLVVRGRSPGLFEKQKAKVAQKAASSSKKTNEKKKPRLSRSKAKKKESSDEEEEEEEEDEEEEEEKEPVSSDAEVALALHESLRGTRSTTRSHATTRSQVSTRSQASTSRAR